MFCPQPPFWKLYNEEALSYTYTLTHVNWDEPKEFNSSKSLTLKVKPRNILSTFLPTDLNIDF